MKYYNLNHFKLLNSNERKRKRELHPFTTSEKYLFSKTKVKLKDIDSHLVKIVQNLLTDLFIIYDAAFILNKNLPKYINYYTNYIRELTKKW